LKKKSFSIINSADFIKSSSKITECPEVPLPEFAFIGRSNVGKSSLINMLTNKKKLAKTSSTPGKTKLINHFLINNSWHIVDLPGFGFAKAPKKEKEKWQTMICDYITQRKQLLSTFFLIDIRHEPQTIDLNFLIWMGKNQLPFAITFTKTDKINKEKVKTNIDKYSKILSEYFEPLPKIFKTSATKSSGRDELLEYIYECKKVFDPKLLQL